MGGIRVNKLSLNNVKTKVLLMFDKVIPVVWTTLLTLMITAFMGCVLGWLIKSFLKIIGVI